MLGFETADLLCGMLALDEYERYSIEEVADTRFLQNVVWERFKSSIMRGEGDRL